MSRPSRGGGSERGSEATEDKNAAPHYLPPLHSLPAQSSNGEAKTEKSGEAASAKTSTTRRRDARVEKRGGLASGGWRGAKERRALRTGSPAKIKKNGRARTSKRARTAAAERAPGRARTLLAAAAAGLAAAAVLSPASPLRASRSLSGRVSLLPPPVPGSPRAPAAAAHTNHQRCSSGHSTGETPARADVASSAPLSAAPPPLPSARARVSALLPRLVAFRAVFLFSCASPFFGDWLWFR